MLDDLIQQFRRRLNLETTIGYLGDGSGEVHNRTRPGYYHVRFRQANGTFTAPVSLRAHPNANLPDMDGLAVIIGYDPSGDQIILEAFSPGIDAAGINPLALNPLDSSANKLKPQSDSLPTFLCTQHADRTNKPLYVVVFPGFVVTASILQYFPGAELDLTSLVPIAGAHRFVVVCLKSDYVTLEAFGSTAKDLDDPLSDDDIEEAYLLRTSGSIAIWAWELRDAQTVLDSDPTKQVDLRAIVGGLSGVIDHGSLTGLTDDDHTQYVITSPATTARNVIQPTSAAVIPLTVKGAAAQSANLQEWQTSAGANVIAINATGEIGIGVAPQNSAGVAIYKLGIQQTSTSTAGGDRAFTATMIAAPASASTAQYYASFPFLQYTGAGATSGLVAATLAQVNVDTNAATITQVVGNYLNVVFVTGKTPTVTSVYANRLAVFDVEDGTVGTAYATDLVMASVDTGALTTSYGVKITQGVKGAGTLTSQYALYIGDVDAAATNNYAIVTNAGLVVFNEGGHAGADFRIESDTDANNFVSDASDNAILIGTATPVSGIKLLVSGAQRLTSFLEQTEQAAPATPASGFGRWYVSTTGVPRFINDAGTDSDLTASGAGGSIAVKEDAVSIVAAADTIDFKDFNVEDLTGNDAGVYHNLPGIIGGRLTLTTGVPVTTSDVTAATTLYYAIHLHNKIALYDGTRWKVFTFAELSLALTSYTASLPYDIFIYDNAGTLTLESTAWTNDTTRATALARQDGVWCKTGALTRRYVGTIRITGTTGQTEDSTSRRFVWNAYNRVNRALRALETTDSWTYATAAFRAANNVTTVGVTRVEIVIGLSEDLVKAKVWVMAGAGVASGVATGVGIDSTTVNSAPIRVAIAWTTGPSSVYSGYPGIGYHYIQWLEYGNTGITFYGDAGGARDQSGMEVAIIA